MKHLSRTTTALAAAFALTALPAGASLAQQTGCQVVEGPGSDWSDIDCPDDRDDQDQDVGGVGTTRPDSDEDEDVEVLPGRIDRPTGGAPAVEDDVEAAPAVQSQEPQLAATGTDADVALVAGLAALTLGGGALVAARRRQRTES